MYEIKQITDEPRQKRTMFLPDGSPIGMTIYFVSMQQGWFITELTYGDFTLNGLRISNQPNMLFQWRNLLPFGLACFSKADREPSLPQDFSSGASKLYILTQAEVDDYAGLLSA